MLNVALTGNVASGKSIVARHFAEWGATVIDADELVREAQQPGSETLAAIVDRFGRDVLCPDGSLDRGALRRKAMGNEESLAALNAIVHPVVQQRRAELATATAARGDCVLVNDIPLLFEVLNPDDFDLVVLVDAPVELRHRRLTTLRGMPAEEADHLIAAQAPTDRKRERSDIVLDNAGTLAQLEDAARGAWRSIRARAAARLAGRGGPLLAVTAHPDDAAFAIGGTLARYADAGIETHLVCATAGESPRELSEDASLLGLTGTVGLGYSAGTLESHDASAVNALAHAIRRIAPAVIVTFGADGGNGHRDHVAVHQWTHQASSQARSACSLFYVAYPEPVARRISSRLRGTPDRQLAARLDVRPWQDVKRAANAAHASGDAPFDLDDPSASPPMEREWYAAERAAIGLETDLYQGLERRG